MVTSEPVRDRMVALTRSISVAVNPIRRLMEGEGLSKGTTTAKERSSIEGRATIETLRWGGKVQQGCQSVTPDVAHRTERFNDPDRGICSICRHRRSRPTGGGAGSVLQRGGRHRQGGQGLPHRPAACRDLRL